MNKKINLLRKKFKKYNIDGYIVSKNDDYFTEYSKINRLEIISNFTGSAGLAIILKDKNYLFTDGRYTIQSQMESGKDFKIISYDKIINFDLVKNLTLGIDPKLFTYEQIKKYFLKNNKIKFITKNLIDEIKNKKIKDNFKFFSLKKEIVGESSKSKINKIAKYLKENKSDYLLVSAPENVAWILNIRGGDGPNSPVPNSRLIISKTKKIFLISKIYKTEKLIKDKIIKSKEVIDIVPTASLNRLVSLVALLFFFFIRNVGVISELNLNSLMGYQKYMSTMVYHQKLWGFFTNLI